MLSYDQPSFIIGSTSFILSFFYSTLICSAQISSDTTTATNIIQVDSKNFIVNDGQRRVNNLFHSFDRFSVPSNGSVYFNNDPLVENIFSRVTGNGLSFIDGLIRANGNANLFLLNSNGIQFGPNTSLQLGGSFLASTAENLVFEDGFIYSTEPRVSPNLTITVPIGLQFGHEPGPISTQARNPLTFQGLTITAGQTLALIGGDITLDNSTLTVPGGRIEIGSIADAGVVDIISINGGLSFDYDRSPARGNIKLINQPILNINGSATGTIRFVGNNITVTDGALIIAFTTQPILDNIVPPVGIEFDTIESLIIDGHTLVATQSFVPSITSQDILINSKNLEVKNNSEITAAGSIGMGGNIEINSNNINVLDGSSIRTLSPMSQGGDITIHTQTITLKRDSRIAAPGGGASAGEVNIHAQESILISGGSSEITSRATTNGGDGGRVNIQTHQISLVNGGSISTSSFGSGQAGALTLDVDGTILVSGQSENQRFASSIFSQVVGNIPGDAGSIEINTDRLIVEDGAEVSVGVVRAIFEPSPLGVGGGNAGTLRINAKEFIEVKGSRTNVNGDTFPSAIIAEAQGSGNAGDLILVTEELRIQDNGVVSVRSLIEGEAGNVSVLANNINLDNNGSIIAETEFGNGGNINLTTRQLLSLRNQSVISTTGGIDETSGNGGNINISAGVLLALPSENSDINTNAFSGNGGTIEITAQGIFGLQFRSSPTELSDITANSQIGFDGMVNLEVPDVDPSDSLNKLPSMPVVVNPIERRCQQAASANPGQFVLTNRGGIARRPSSPQVNRYSLNHLVHPVLAQHNSDSVRQSVLLSSADKLAIVEAQGWLREANGSIVLVATPTKPAAIATLPDQPICRGLG